MPGKKSVEKESNWRELIKRQAVSGLSIRRFCAKEGVSQPSFYAWRRRFREEDNGLGARQSRSRKDERVGRRPFIPLTLLESPAGLEIVHPHGYQIRVTGGVDADTLRQVLHVLDGRGDG